MKKQLFLKSLLIAIGLLIASINTAWAWTATFRCVPALTFGANWSSGNTCKVFFNADYGWGDATSVMSPTGLMYESGGNLYEIYSVTRSDLPGDGVRNVHFERWDGSSWKENQGQYNNWETCSTWDGKMHYGSWGSYTYKTFNISANTTIYFDNSDLNCTNVRLYFFKDGWNQDASDNNFTQIAGTPYWYKTYTEAWNGYAGLVFKNQANWDKKSGNIYQGISGTSTCFTPTSGDNGASLSTTAPVGPKNIAISNTASIVRGEGTEGNPYVVAPGTSLTQSVSAETIDGSTTLNYKFSAGSASSYSSSTTTNTRIASAVAGTSYNVYATVKTMKSSNSSREFNTNTLYYTTAYTITLNDNGGSGGDGASYAVNGKAAINPTSIPSLSGKGFDGYWTGAGGTGTQVINEKGQWNTGIAGYTDNDGNWICTSNSTLYARWLDPGYYMVGGFNNWKATTKMSGSGPYTWDTESLDPGDYTSNKTGFKIRKVVEGSGTLDVWYGGSSEGIELGKESTSSTSIASPGNNFILQVYYDGVYSFTWTANSKIQVAVPVVDQLRIYKDNDASVSIYTDWVDPSAATVTATVALERGHTYQFKPVLESVYYGKGSGSTYTTLTRDSYSVTVGTGNTNANNVKLSADLKGNYTFNFTSSTNSLSVTYPTRRQINYSVVTKRSGNGTASGANGSLSAENDSDGDFAVSSGGYVVDGNSVTFRAPAAKSGYTWRGWFSKNNPSDWDDGKVSTSTNDYYTTTVTGGNTTVYAIYSENTYTVAVDSTSNYTASGNYGGCVKVSGSKVGSVSNVGVDSYAEIVAVPTNAAWHFKEWDIPSGVTIKSGSTTSATIQINATAGSLTVTAKFEPRYTLIGSNKDNSNRGMPGWSHSDAIDFVVNDYTAYNDLDFSCMLTTLEPNTRYKFLVYDRKNDAERGCTSSSEASALLPAAGQDKSNWSLNNSNVVYFDTEGYGTYTFKITTITNDDYGYPSVEIQHQASSKLTLGWGYAQIDALNTVNSGNTGGSVTAQTTESGENFTITNNQYVANGGSITFTAAHATGYTLEGWYNNSDYAANHKISSGGNYSIDGNTLTVSSISADLAIYAKFVETSTAVTFSHNAHGHVEIGSATVTNTTVGVTTTRTIKAVPDAGYYFAGWTVPGGADFSVADASGASDNGSKSTTLTGLGAGTAGTLTAVFEENSKIYFRNVFDDGTNPATHWSSVYVYFGVDWHSTQGVHKTGNLTEYAEMHPVATGSYTYWAYIPHAYKDNEKIAFANVDHHNDYSFYGNNGVYRTDYKPALNMFVPHHQSSETKNTTTYYSNGYWMNYGEAGSPAGYYIMRYTGSGYENPADNGTGSNQFVIIDENTIQYSLRIDNSSYDHNRFRITSAYGTQYITANGGESGTTITTSNCDDNLVLSEYKDGSPRFSINQTIHGIYVITIDQSGDAMKIRVNYPVAVNDYRLHHTYTISATTHDTYSDVIKNGSTTTKVSMFINTANTPTMALEKCTAISNKGVPIWTDQSAGMSISTASGNFDDGNGVYEFDFALSTHAMSNIKLYDGEFYIKTDIASGGWTAYKANIMEKNSITFDSGDPKTYDYAFCHWVGKARSTGSATNVKCVIANDYNIAISDTLEHDAIIGDGANKYQTLPSPAHVRFSYNSTTNELKRTYLAVSGDDHLIMEGNTITSGSTVYMIKDKNGTAFSNNKATLENQSNFTFGLDIKARETARVRLSAKYNGTIQDLIGHVTSYGSDLDAANTVEIIGGSSANTGYNDLRISYDFKTNQLLSAWLPPTSGDSPDKAINADVMIIREEQGDARQITFAKNTDALSAVDTVYGVMKFNKYSLNNRNKTNTADSVRSAYARDLYWISFPFNVKLSDAFGMGTYGTHWIIEYYDGKGRAKNGFWADSEPNWKFVTPYMRDTGFVMKANEGYILALDLVQLGYSSLVWDNNMTEAYLYFPSQSTVGNIKKTDVTVKVDTVGYTCTINRSTPDGNRTIKDSHWHCIGAPSFANVSHAATTNWKDADVDYPNVENWKTNTLLFVYDWNSVDNSLTPVSAASHNFKAMHAYMVQYSQPTISWTSASTPDASSVAARLADTPDREYQLALLREDEEQDHTYVRLSDNENVTMAFEFNYDLSKELNKNRGNIWTVTTDGTQVAGNSMPHPLATTIVPVGVKIATSGEYTFTMPEGTNGENVWLLDNQTNSRTNLGLMDYTVNLTAGTIDGRFSLEFGPIQDAPTGIDEMSTVNSQLSTDSVRKVFVGGRLYIIRDGKAYDATGAQVR